MPSSHWQVKASAPGRLELADSRLLQFQCQLVITQTSLIGSILSNILLVLGMSFFVGGLRYCEQQPLQALFSLP